MAGLSGIVKKISDLVTGTPADDDCFVFGKSDLKKITLAKLKDVLGITSINSALFKINAVDSKDGSSFNRDFQSIGLSDPESELSKTAFFLINASEQDQWSHIPTGLITTSVSVGIREVFRYSSTVIMIKVTEIHPKPGTQYFRTYNSGEWNEGGWKVISPD